MKVSRKPLFWAVSLGHITNDMFMALGPVVLTFIAAHVMPISNTQIGIAISARQLVGALSQPFFGLVGDRTGGRWLGAGGVGWTVSFMLLAMFLAGTGNFWLMIIPFALSSLGSGAFHPIGSMHAADSNKDNAATNLSWFFLFGQAGLAIGPALAGFLLDRAATHNHLFISGFGPLFSGKLAEHGSIAPLFVLGLMGIPAVLSMALTIPNRQAYGAHRKREAATQTTVEAAIPVKALVILGLMVALRSLVQPGVADFIPRMFQLRGWSAAEYGLITSSFWLATGITGVMFGALADRYDGRYVIAASLLLSIPAFFLLPLTDGMAAFLLATAAGALSGGSHTVIVLIAQSLIPGRKGFASGSILGFMFATGALGTLLIGWMSEQIGLSASFQLAAALTIIPCVLCLALPAMKPKAQRVPVRLPEKAVEVT
jgi:MFS transporter, FSR family, fosmidomycin resistance protein